MRQAFESPRRLGVMDVGRVKSVPILEVAEALGLVPRGRRVACPSHRVGDGVDAHPSCQLYAASNRFYCFACGNRGDVIDLVSRSGRVRFAAHRLLFPFWQDGAPVYLQGRRYGRAEPRYLGMRGPIPCLYNVAALDADEVWVAEGCIDTLTLASAGVAAVGVVGARGLKAAWLPQFAGKSVVLALDNDAVGRDATAQVLHRLAPYAAALRVAELPEGADVNAYCVEHRWVPATRETDARA